MVNLATLSSVFQSLGDQGSQVAQAKFAADDYRLKQILDRLGVQQAQLGLKNTQQEMDERAEQLRRLKMQPATATEEVQAKIASLEAALGRKLTQQEKQLIFGLPMTSNIDAARKEISDGMADWSPEDRAAVQPSVDYFLGIGDPEKAFQVYSQFAERRTDRPKETSTQPVQYTDAKGQKRSGYRDPKTRQIYDASTGQLVENARNVIPVSEIPTTSVVSGWRPEPQPDGSIKMVPTTTVTTRSKGAGAPQATATPSQGVTVGGKNPLSQQAKQTIETIDTGMQMIDKAEQALQSTNVDRLKLIEQYAKYKVGMAVDPPYDQIIPTVALLKIMLTTPYLRGLRNFNWIQMIGLHLPNPTDSPELIRQKMNQLKQNLPILENTIRNIETGGSSPSPSPTPAANPAKPKSGTDLSDLGGQPG